MAGCYPGSALKIYTYHGVTETRSFDFLFSASPCLSGGLFGFVGFRFVLFGAEEGEEDYVAD